MSNFPLYDKLAAMNESTSDSAINITSLISTINSATSDDAHIHHEEICAIIAEYYFRETGKYNVKCYGNESILGGNITKFSTKSLPHNLIKMIYNYIRMFS